MTKRQAILDAAKDLIVTCGLQQITLPMIFATAGVGSGTTYHYFPGGLSEILNTLFAETQELLDGEMLSAVLDGKTLEKDAETLFTSFLDFCMDRPKELAVLLACGHAPIINQALRQRTTKAISLFTAFIARGQASGAFRSLPPVPAYLMISGSILALVQGHHDGKYRINGKMKKQAMGALLDFLSAPIGTFEEPGLK
jgi:TetR/AcrR family transcriptional regulator, repressor of fatR-cypB operon